MSNIQERKAAMLAELRELGVVRLEVEYSGSGDSGQVDSVSAFKAGDDTIYDVDKLWNERAVDRIPVLVSNVLLGIEDESLADKYSNLATDALDHLGASDWYNNDGGGGKMIVFVEEGEDDDGDKHEAGSVHFDHYYYTQETTNESYEL